VLISAPGSLSSGPCARQCKRDWVALRDVDDRHFSGPIEDGIGDRTDMRVNALEVAQHVKVKRRCLQALGPTFA
jgi:hypothetical protein